MDFDFENFTTLIKYADSGVKLTDRAAGLAKSIKDLVGSSKTPGDQELKALVVELMSEVTDAKLANVELKTQLLTLKQAAVNAQTKADEFARYELWETPAGQHVYRLKEQAAKEESTHYLCPTCKEDGIKSILQGHQSSKGCQRCQAWFDFRGHDVETSTKRTRPKKYY
ncbi:hypothetical protein [Flexibacterium corallicola]|uniref:hypothetical protein n=1 Tax=Flexibacterium corallicola TaxID=3037259 RepID=UPI00286EB8DC|nr:hypothetical protein [Pseudovibrio sp. M1P-2-3]